MHELELWAPEGGLDLKRAAYDSGDHTISSRVAPSTYSIKSEFDGANVLLTGASGYIGSVVLEQLLRCTNVSTVRCLMRDKRSERA
jgi:FlaA1/EpsC-like NDP-sugar epimerase